MAGDRAPAMAADKHRLGAASWLLLLLVCAAAFLPGISTLPPVDRDEARFVQASRQMAETGDYLDIRFQDQPRYKKPIGIYWLQSAAIALGGRADSAIWTYRTVSVIGATAAVLATAWIGAYLFGAQAGLLAGIGLAGIVMLGFEARIAKTDAALLATAVLAQAALARVFVATRRGRTVRPLEPFVFWTALGAGVLIKGPVVPMLCALTVIGVFAVDRRADWLKALKPLPGIALTLLIVAPWLVAITAKSGAAFWQESLGRDAFGKVVSGQESHGAPPGYYFIAYSVFMWPFAALALDGGLRALNRLREDPRLLFCLAWFVPYWIAIELIPTKLPHYILPAYPALLLLMGWTVADPEARAIEPRRWQLWLVRLSLFGAVLVTALLAAAAAGLQPYFLGRPTLSGAVACVLMLLAGWLGSGLFPPLPASRRVPAATLAAVAAFALMTTAILPSLRPIWISRQIAEAFEAHRPCPQSRLASAGYAEPSLVFLTRTDTLLSGGANAAEFLAADPACAMAVVSDDQRDAFLRAVPGGEAGVTAVAGIEGINYSNGRKLRMSLYRAARP